MGRKTARIEVDATLSNSNDEQDEADQQAWDRFVSAVRELAAQPEYAGLDVEVRDVGSW